jgi:hypothetical protein
MVAGLVIGTLEKFYRQPSFFARPILYRVLSLHYLSTQKPIKKAQSYPR